MIEENDNQHENELIFKILERINKKKNVEIFKVYWETLKNDIKNVAKMDVESIPNLYVYIYSIGKMYLQNYSRKSIQKIEELYEFFHILFNCTFNHDPSKLTSILAKDDNIEGILLNHFEIYSTEGKTSKYIFDIILICLKSKDQLESQNKFAPMILELILKTSLSEDEFLSRKSHKLISQILELKVKTMPILVNKTEKFIFPILETWFIKTKDLPKILDLIKKTIAYFSTDVKLKVFEFLLPIAEGKSTILTKIKIFEIIETVFAGAYFSIKFTQTVLDNLIKIEDMFVQLLTDKKLVITFFKARLQVLLNFYSLDPLSAKFYIPSFISSLFEFFAADTYQELAQITQEEDRQKVQLKKGKHNSVETNEQTDNNQNMEETFNFYKRFSFKLFGLLIENTFDYSLFAELNPISSQSDFNQISDLMNNLNLEENSNTFFGKTTIFKIFTLMNHVISARFIQNFSFTLQILSTMVKKISELGFKSWTTFNEQIAKFYITVRNLQLQEDIPTQTRVHLESFLTNIICSGDLLIIIPLIFKISPGQQFDVNNLNNSDFVFFVHILAQKGNNYRFAALYDYMVMIYHFIIDHYLEQSIGTKMETEKIDENEFSKEVFDQKLESNFIEQVLSTLPKFTCFELSDVQNLEKYAVFITSTLFTDKIYTNPLICRHFITILNSLMIFLVHNKTKIDKEVFDRILSGLKNSSALAKICKLLIKVGKNSNKLHFENFLKLFSKLFPDDFTSGIIVKNISRLEKLIKSPDLIQQSKGIVESAIISSLLTGFEELGRRNDLYNLSLGFAQTLFLCSGSESVKMGFKILSALLTNIHQTQYPQLLIYVEGLLNGFLKGQFVDKKFENNCLKFVNQLLNSYFINLEIDDFKLKIQHFCEKYFNFIVFNFKNRNQKTRKAAQKVLSFLFQKYHGIEIQTEVDNTVTFASTNEPIDSNSFLICCLISGLASETIVAKASCVEAISFILKEFGTYMTKDLIHSIMKVVVLLFKEKNHEIYTSSLKFMTRVLKKQDIKIVEENLPLIIEAVFEWDADSAKKSNAKLKNFISLLNRKYVFLKDSRSC